MLLRSHFKFSSLHRTAEPHRFIKLQRTMSYLSVVPMSYSSVVPAVFLRSHVFVRSSFLVELQIVFKQSTATPGIDRDVPHKDLDSFTVHRRVFRCTQQREATQIERMIVTLVELEPVVPPQSKL